MPSIASSYQRYILLFLFIGFIYFLILQAPDDDEDNNEGKLPPVHRDPVPEPHYERKIVGIGDLHGDLPNALKVLQMTGVIDEHAHWTGDVDFLVQTGDIIGEIIFSFHLSVINRLSRSV